MSFIGLCVLMMGASDGVAEIQNKDRTGTPDGDNNCNQCHNDGNFSASINISVQDGMGNEVDTYLPGETYTVGYLITSTGNPSGYGFQSTVLLEDLSNAGTFMNPSANAQLESVNDAPISNRHVVEHSSASATGVFSVDWVAPASSGDVTFYASGNVVNGDNNSDGDRGTPSVTKVLAPDPSIGFEDLSNEWVSFSQNGTELIIDADQIDFLDRIEIYNIHGQQVRAIQNLNLPYTLNSHGAQGIYLMVIQNNNEILSKKILF